MAIFTKYEILSAIKENKISFTPPLDSFQIQPHGIDLRLGWDFFIPKTWTMTEIGRVALYTDYFNKVNNNFDKITLKKKQIFELLPHEVIIATTLEKMEFHSLDIMAILYPRSSLNRKGLALDLSGVIDVGYHGYLILPIRNNTNQIIKLYPGERICQLVIETLCREINSADALMHGLNKAKYSHSCQINHELDKIEENKLIDQGEIEKLKEHYQIKNLV